MIFLPIAIKEFQYERHGIQRPSVLTGTPGPTTSADVSRDVGSGSSAEHKALWETGGVCVHGNRCSS